MADFGGPAGIGDAHSAMNSQTDDLAEHYTAVASDGKKSAKLREASVLFSVAEEKLTDLQDFEECLSTAKQARALFEESKDQKGIADSIRLEIHAMRAKASALRGRIGTSKNEIHDVLKAASELAKSKAEEFKGKGDKRSEAAMHLAYAEVNQDKRGRKKRDEAFEKATVSRKLAKEISDKQLEAHATFCICFLHQKMKMRIEAVELANEVVKLYKDMGDKKKEAESLHLLGVCRVQAEQFEDGVAAASEALGIFREMKNIRMQAFENYVIAQYYMIRNIPQQALQVAVEAMQLFKEDATDAKDQGWTAQSYSSICQCLEMNGQNREALRYAEECCEWHAHGRNKRGEALSYSILARAQLANDKLSDALEAAENGLNAAEAMKDVRWEAHMMREKAQVLSRMKNYTEASKVASEAAALMQGLQDKNEEGLLLNTVSEIAIEQNDWETLQRTVEEQRACFQQSGDRSKEATCLCTAAGCMANENFEDALAMVKNALDIYEEIHDIRGCARAHKVYASMYKSKGDYESALESAECMREQMQKTGDKAAEAEAVTLMAELQLARDNPPAAVRLANEAQSLCKRSGDRHAEAQAWILVSTALCEHFMQDGQATMEKKRAKALKPAQEGLSMAKKLNSPHLIAHALYQVGTVHMLTGRTGDATQAANEARSLFHKLGSKRNETSVVMLIAETLYSAGKEDRAIEKCEEVIAMAEGMGDADNKARAEKLIEKIKPPAPPMGQFFMPPPGAMPAMAAPAAGGDAGAAPAAAASAVVAVPEAKGISIEMAMECVRTSAAQATSSDDIENDTALMDAGLDSLSALTFRQAVAAQVEMKLPSSFVFDFPTIRDAAQKIVDMSLE